MAEISRLIRDANDLRGRDEAGSLSPWRVGQGQILLRAAQAKMEEMESIDIVPRVSSAETRVRLRSDIERVSAELDSFTGIQDFDASAEVPEAYIPLVQNEPGRRGYWFEPVWVAPFVLENQWQAVLGHDEAFNSEVILDTYERMQAFATGQGLRVERQAVAAAGGFILGAALVVGVIWLAGRR